MVDLKNADFKLPVGLEKDRNPLGHSGHRRLHAVVGSKETLMGIPHWTGLLMYLLR